jgi:hypothetical protein
MKSFWTWLARISFGVTALVVLLLGGCLVEVLATTPDSAKRHIQLVFEEECRQKAVNAQDYNGPFLKAEDFWHHEFYWVNEHGRGSALGLVQFFPLQSEIWFLEAGSKF